VSLHQDPLKNLAENSPLRNSSKVMASVFRAVFSTSSPRLFTSKPEIYYSDQGTSIILYGLKNGKMFGYQTPRAIYTNLYYFAKCILWIYAKIRFFVLVLYFINFINWTACCACTLSVFLNSGSHRFSPLEDMLRVGIRTKKPQVRSI
jgi:hypothetical protein